MFNYYDLLTALVKNLYINDKAKNLIFRSRVIKLNSY